MVSYKALNTFAKTLSPFCTKMVTTSKENRVGGVYHLLDFNL